MTILAVNENRDSPSGSNNFEAGPAYIREFTAYCSSIFDGPQTLLTSGTFPVVGQAWVFGSEFNEDAICQTVTVTKQEDHGRWTDGSVCYLWDIRCEFRINQPDSSTPPSLPENPLLRPVIIRGNTSFYSEFSQKDKDGNPIINSAKELFPPHEVEKDLVEFEFVRNEAVSPAGFARFYAGRVNQSPIWGAPERSIRCLGIAWEKQYENGYEFYSCTYRFAFKEDLWQLELVDNGFNELKGSPQKLVPILLDDGTRPTEPFKLNGSGAKLADNAAPVLLPKFNIYKEANFGSLGLPSSI